MRSLSVLRKAAKILIGSAVFSVLLLITGSVTAHAQPWTAVGSTGVVVSGRLSYDCFDQAIGFFRHPLPFVDCLAPPVIKRPSASANLSSSTGGGSSASLFALPTGSGRVLYNVVAEPNLSESVVLTARYLASDTTNQHITVRLIEQPRNSTSTSVKVLLTLNSDNYAQSSSTQTQTVGCPTPPTLDFGTNAYYIVADISNADTTGGAVGLYQLAVDTGTCLE